MFPVHANEERKQWLLLQICKSYRGVKDELAGELKLYFQEIVLEYGKEWGGCLEGKQCSIWERLEAGGEADDRG